MIFFFKFYSGLLNCLSEYFGICSNMCKKATNIIFLQRTSKYHTIILKSSKRYNIQDNVFYECSQNIPMYRYEIFIWCQNRTIIDVLCMIFCDIFSMTIHHVRHILILSIKIILLIAIGCIPKNNKLDLSTSNMRLFNILLN